MQPNYRDGDIVPVDFNPPVTPFDLSRQNLGTNTEGESNWQGWESLLVRSEPPFFPRWAALLRSC